MHCLGNGQILEIIESKVIFASSGMAWWRECHKAWPMIHVKISIVIIREQDPLRGFIGWRLDLGSFHPMVIPMQGKAKRTIYVQRASSLADDRVSYRTMTLAMPFTTQDVAYGGLSYSVLTRSRSLSVLLLRRWWNGRGAWNVSVLSGEPGSSLSSQRMEEDHIRWSESKNCSCFQSHLCLTQCQG